MAKVLITVLGANRYSECDYFYKDETIRTSYIQEALYKIFCKDFKKANGDKIILLLTKRAREMNYETSDESQPRLDKVLSKFDVNIETVEIPIGANELELKDIFDKLVAHTNEKDEVIMDITHSFRNIPIQAIVALNYARLLKNICIKGIYYGAFEAGIDQKETAQEIVIPCSCGREEVPKTIYIKRVEIFNLFSYIELLDWTHAINIFLKTGSAKEISDLYQVKKVELNKQQDRSVNHLGQIVANLKAFTDCIANSRGQLLQANKKISKQNQRSIGIAAQSLNKAIQDFKQAEQEKLPLVPLFELVYQKIQPFLATDNVAIGIATVKWCIEYQMIQQGYTALEETLTTFMCRLLGGDENNHEYRIKRGSTALACMSIPNKDEWIIQEMKHIKDDKEQFIKQIEALQINNSSLGELAQQVKGRRNDINHFGFQADDAVDCETFENDLKNFIEKFEQLTKEYKGAK